MTSYYHNPYPHSKESLYSLPTHFSETDILYIKNKIRENTRIGTPNILTVHDKKDCPDLQANLPKEKKSKC